MAEARLKWGFSTKGTSCRLTREETAYVFNAGEMHNSDWGNTLRHRAAAGKVAVVRERYLGVPTHGVRSIRQFMKSPPFQVILFPDAARFLDRAEAWLLEREAKYNLLLGIARRLTESCEGYDDPMLFATVERQDQIEGCVFRTPPHKLALTEMPYEAVSEVVRAVADHYQELPAVLGPEPVVGAFAREWARLRPVHWIPGMRQRIYKLEKLNPLRRTVAGAARRATLEDLLTVSQWLERFSQETGIATRRAQEMAELLIDHDALLLWDDDGSKSMAGTQGRTSHGVRISYVYTPEEYRGRGYASAVVHSLSRQMLDEGCDFCVLYTDVSNPTSNAIYARMGYEPIDDVRDYNFVPRSYDA